MITTTLRFTGNSAQGAEIYRSYYLVADEVASGGGKSSVIPMSAQAVMPESVNAWAQCAHPTCFGIGAGCFI